MIDTPVVSTCSSGLGLRDRFLAKVVTKLLPLIGSLDKRMATLRRRYQVPEMVVFEDLTASWVASAVGVCVHLELPEMVPDDGGVSLGELGLALGVRPEVLLRLVRMVSAHGYFHLHGDEVSHSRLSRALLAGRAGDFAKLQTSSWYRECFSSDEVVAAMRAGRVPFDIIAGSPFFDYLKPQSEKEVVFSRAMASITGFAEGYLQYSLTFEAGDKVLDVGGSDGSLCRLLQKRYPDCRFAFLDIHDTTESADRVTKIVGDFFAAVPRGYNRLILKNILHDWDDEKCLAILGNCRAAAEKGDRLSVVELLLPESGGELTSRAAEFAVDWNIFCTLGGQERMKSEYRALLEQTGWRLLSCEPTATPYWVLQAEAV